MKRIAIVGTSGAGKSHLAERIAERLEVPHVQLDALCWGPGWTARDPDVFRESVDRATTAPLWICDGNYGAVRDLVWTRADTLVWLNYSFPLVFWRILRRTLHRSLTQQLLFSGNRESLVTSLFTVDSVVLWSVRTHWKHKREYPIAFRRPEWKPLRIMELNNPRDADALVEALVDLKPVG